MEIHRTRRSQRRRRILNPEGLKIWFDVITPKDVLFFEPMMKRLSEKNKIMTTTRDYREAVGLAKVRGVRMRIVGRHGGSSLIGKLRASAHRIEELTEAVNRFGPDLTISFCSPEASRVAFGLGIRHVGFCNTPHSAAVMKLSVPMLDKLLVPSHIPKRKFAMYGISPSDIVQYDAMDEYVIVKNSSGKPRPLRLRLKKEKTILFRPHETQAAYASDVRFDTVGAVKAIADGFPDYNVVVLGRYVEQIEDLKRELGDRAVVPDKVVDSKAIFAITDVFVGSGGTMTTEAAMRGIPTVSYEGIPNADEKYLVRKGLVRRCGNYSKIPQAIGSALAEDAKVRTARVERFLGTMEDPYDKLVDVIRLLG